MPRECQRREIRDGEDGPCRFQSEKADIGSRLPVPSIRSLVEPSSLPRSCPATSPSGRHLSLLEPLGAFEVRVFLELPFPLPSASRCWPFQTPHHRVSQGGC